MKDAFTIYVNVIAYTEDEQKNIPTLVAKLFYLAKQAETEILIILSFLCTRITQAMIEDARTLFQVLGLWQKNNAQLQL